MLVKIITPMVTNCERVAILVDCSRISRINEQTFITHDITGEDCSINADEVDTVIITTDYTRSVYAVRVTLGKRWFKLLEGDPI